MVLIAFLGSELGCQSYKLLLHNQMPVWVGEGKIRQRAGTTPPVAAVHRGRAGRSRPLPDETGAGPYHQRIKSVSRTDLGLIRIESQSSYPRRAS